MRSNRKTTESAESKTVVQLPSLSDWGWLRVWARREWARRVCLYLIDLKSYVSYLQTESVLMDIRHVILIHEMHECTHTQRREGASIAHLFVNLSSPYEKHNESYFDYAWRVGTFWILPCENFCIWGLKRVRMDFVPTIGCLLPFNSNCLNARFNQY